MKALLSLCLLSLPIAASAQKLVASHPSVIYKIGSEKAYLYQEPADTARNKSTSFLSSGEDAFVVGEFSPRWAIVKRIGALYLTPTNKLSNYNSAEIKASQAADAAGLPVDPTTKLITYEEVIEVSGVSKADLYRRAYEWLAKIYRSANDVIQLNDKGAGQLVAQGLVRVYSKGRDAGVVRHTLTLYIKDGRYKYILTNLAHETSAQPGFYSGGPLEQSEAKLYPSGVFGAKRTWADIRQDANVKMRSLLADLRASMSMQGKKDPGDF